MSRQGGDRVMAVLLEASKGTVLNKGTVDQAIKEYRLIQQQMDKFQDTISHLELELTKVIRYTWH